MKIITPLFLKRSISLRIIQLGFFIAPLFLLAQTQTIQRGKWSNPANWTNGTPTSRSSAKIDNEMILDEQLWLGNSSSFKINQPVIDPKGGATENIEMSGNASLEIDAKLFIEGDMKIENNSTLRIGECDTLKIGRNLDLGNNVRLTIEPCAVLIVEGNLKLKNNVRIIADGNIKVFNIVDGKNNSTISGNGNLQTNGKVSLKNGASIFGSRNGCNKTPCEYGSGIGLPITLDTVYGRFVSENAVQIYWSTLSEINNDYFTLAYSENGKDFTFSRKVEGFGNSTNSKKYSTIVKNMEGDQVYIRLSQTDYNGRNETFPPILIQKEAEAKSTNNPQSSVRLYPNPFISNQLFLKAENLKVGKYEIKIIDLNGKTWARYQKFVETTPNEFQWSLIGREKLNQGIYLIQLEGPESLRVMKFLTK